MRWINFIAAIILGFSIFVGITSQAFATWWMVTLGIFFGFNIFAFIFGFRAKIPSPPKEGE